MEVLKMKNMKIKNSIGGIKSKRESQRKSRVNHRDFKSLVMFTYQCPDGESSLSCKQTRSHPPNIQNQR